MKQSIQQLFTTAACTTVLLLASVSAKSAIVTQHFELIFERSQRVTSGHPAPFSGTYLGSLSYESDTPLSSRNFVPGGTISQYQNVMTSLDLSSVGIVGDLSTVGRTTVNIWDNTHSGSQDKIQFEAVFNALNGFSMSWGDYDVSSFYIWMTARGGSAFSGDALPSELPTGAFDFEQRFQVSLSDGAFYTGRFNFTDVPPPPPTGNVPVPATLPLLAIGLMCLLSRRLRRSH